MVNLCGSPCFVKSIGLFVKADSETRTKAGEFKHWLESRNIRVVRMESAAPSLRQNGDPLPTAPADLDCIFALGGDGTFLSAVHWIGNGETPIHGIKFGDVGVLAETEADNLYTAAEAILGGFFAIQDRRRLSVKVIRDGE